GFVSCGAQAAAVKIYAAASLTNAITDINKEFQRANPAIEITPVFAASSVLTKQVESGAPADIFFSADEKWMRYLIDKKQMIAPQSLPLLRNQLVVIAPKKRNFPFKPIASFNFAGAFKGYLCTGQLESVPAGMYARQSLIKLGWLDALKGRIVETDDVRAALAFVERSECASGIVYATDARISKKVTVLGILPENSHQPIVYPLGLTARGNGNPDARKFLHYLKSSAKARAVFQHYGFVVIPSTAVKSSVAIKSPAAIQ
ncbi:MAG: molybdate ABC transporter substrate-binding protein, partial [Moraxellaceae bacterium]